jgi:hypothetical protein
MAVAALAAMVVVAEAPAQVTLNINVRQQGNASNSIMVDGGSTLNYEVVGTLTPAMNSGHMGLALVSGTLDWSGGALTQANANNPAGYNENVAPDGTCGSAMANFAKPWGIGNPAGFKGTEINGDLVQFAGAQNTIKNVDSADFPIGAVKTGVGATGTNGCGPATILTGSITVPNVGGPFTLTVLEPFANVIGPGQNGSEEFWATLAVGTINVSPLTVSLVTVVEDAVLLSADRPSNANLSQSKRNKVVLTFNKALPGPPGPGEVTIRKLNAADPLFGPDISSLFTFTVNGSELTIQETSTTTAAFENRAWYGIHSAGTWAGVADFCLDYRVRWGDADNNGIINFNDLSAINARVGAPPHTPNGADRWFNVDANALLNFNDISLANTFIAGVGSVPVVKPPAHPATCAP